MVTLTRMEVWKIMNTIDEMIVENERMTLRSSPDYKEEVKARNHALWLIKLKMREVLDYNAKRIAVE